MLYLSRRTNKNNAKIRESALRPQYMCTLICTIHVCVSNYSHTSWKTCSHSYLFQIHTAAVKECIKKIQSKAHNASELNPVLY